MRAWTAEGMLTFLGVRLWDPCDDRIEAEVASSVMVIEVAACYDGVNGCDLATARVDMALGNVSLISELGTPTSRGAAERGADIDSRGRARWNARYFYCI
jgi:hypothetical protein